MTLEYRAEFFNAFNRPALNGPSVDPVNSNFEPNHAPAEPAPYPADGAEAQIVVPPDARGWGLGPLTRAPGSCLGQWSIRPTLSGAFEATPHGDCLICDSFDVGTASCCTGLRIWPWSCSIPSEVTILRSQLRHPGKDGWSHETDSDHLWAGSAAVAGDTSATEASSGASWSGNQYTGAAERQERGEAGGLTG